MFQISCHSTHFSTTHRKLQSESSRTERENIKQGKIQSTKENPEDQRKVKENKKRTKKNHNKSALQFKVRQ